MLRQTLIPLSQRNEWDAHLELLPHAPAHLWSYNHAMSLSSGLETYLYAASSLGFVAACPLSIREKCGVKDVMSPYGFGGVMISGYHEHFVSELTRYMDANGYCCGYINVHPMALSSFKLSESELNQAKKIYFLDIAQPWERLEQGLHKATRYELKKWKEMCFNVVDDKERLFSAFCNLYCQTLTRVNASAVYHFDLESIREIVMDVSAVMLGVENESKEIEAVSVFICAGEYADYQFNAASLIGRQHTRGLIWCAIAYLKKRSVRYLNLGGGMKSGDSLSKFKQSFGGTEHCFVGLKHIYKQTLFDSLCRELCVSTFDLSAYFPPYHKV